MFKIGRLTVCCISQMPRGRRPRHAGTLGKGSGEWFRLAFAFRHFRMFLQVAMADHVSRDLFLFAVGAELHGS
jgi:hypothetical protein